MPKVTEILDRYTTPLTDEMKELDSEVKDFIQKPLLTELKTYLQKKSSSKSKETKLEVATVTPKRINSIDTYLQKMPPYEAKDGIQDWKEAQRSASLDSDEFNSLYSENRLDSKIATYLAIKLRLSKMQNFKDVINVAKWLDKLKKTSFAQKLQLYRTTNKLGDTIDILHRKIHVLLSPYLVMKNQYKELSSKVYQLAYPIILKYFEELLKSEYKDNLPSAIKSLITLNNSEDSKISPLDYNGYRFSIHNHLAQLEPNSYRRYLVMTYIKFSSRLRLLIKEFDEKEEPGDRWEVCNAFFNNNPKQTPALEALLKTGLGSPETAKMFEIQSTRPSTDRGDADERKLRI